MLSPGETVTCAFEATQRASLTVLKQATGGDDTFTFTSQVFGSFAITTTGGTGQQVFADLIPGAYDVSEVVTGTWQLTSATCDNGDTPATINLSAGSTVTCTFANTQSQRTFSIFLPFTAEPDNIKCPWCRSNNADAPTSFTSPFCPTSRRLMQSTCPSFSL